MAVLAPVLLLAFAAAPAPAPDPVEIIRKSVNLDQDNWKKARDYAYIERRQQVDGHGKGSSKTYEVTYLYGKQFRRLIAKDDKPLSSGDAAKEQRRYDKAVAKQAAESPEKRAREDADAEKEREKEREFAREIPDAYDFHVLGEDSIDGHRAWIISATPKPGYVPHDSQAKALNKVRAKVWIDQATYEWVKVDAEVIRPFKWGLFLLALNPGTVLHFTQTRVNNEIWLPKQIAVDVDARVLFKKVTGSFDDTFSNYRKFTSDARMVSATEADRQK
jgi:hypothetical protein